MSRNYALAKADLSASDVVGYGPQSPRGGSDGGGFTPTVIWIGRIADAQGHYRDLHRQLRIDVSQDPDDANFIAFCPFAACAGIGPTPDAALGDLGAEILRLRDELDGTADELLAGDAIELKQRLRIALP